MLPVTGCEEIMYTENAIWMEAPLENVFAVAADVARWPEFLPHYRWVRVVEEQGEQRTVEMAARRSIFPVRWTARQRLLPERGRITYKHLRGVTAGMDVEWRLTPLDGGTHVMIVHDLAPRGWLLRTRLAQWIIGEFFVKGIAARTLAHMKPYAEGEVLVRYGGRGETDEVRPHA
jgi:ribosome-associated toxin RatA of RatAB toxin-antitoxin module